MACSPDLCQHCISNAIQTQSIIPLPNKSDGRRTQLADRAHPRRDPTLRQNAARRLLTAIAPRLRPDRTPVECPMCGGQCCPERLCPVLSIYLRIVMHRRNDALPARAGYLWSDLIHDDRSLLTAGHCPSSVQTWMVKANGHTPPPPLRSLRAAGAHPSCGL